MTGRTVHGSQADGPGSQVDNPKKASEQPVCTPRKSNGPYPPSDGPWVTRTVRTVHGAWADGLPNFPQPKTLDSTDRNEAMQELTMNTTNNRLPGSSRTVRRLGMDGPLGAHKAGRARPLEGQLLLPFVRSPKSTKGLLPNHR
jgi:hypothetical protein